MSDSSKISFATIVSFNGRKLLRVSVNPLYIVPFVRQKIRLLYTSMMEFHSKNILSIRMQKLAFSLPKPTSTDYAATTLNLVCISLLMLFNVSERAWLRGAAHKFCYLYHEYIQINLFSRYRVVVFISTSYAYFLLYAYEFFVTGDILGNINISRYWKFFKYRQRNQWLYSWVSREIQALIQEKDVDIIVHHILGVIDSWRRNEPKGFKMTPESKQEEFKSKIADAAKPFLTGRTDRFVNELEMFIASGLNIEAYDKVYINHLGWKIPDINNEDDKEQEERNPVIPLLSFSDEDLDETT